MLGLLVGVVIANFQGYLWYHSLTFGNIWLSATFPNEKKEVVVARRSSAAYIVSLVSSVALGLLLNFILLHFFKVKTVVDGIKFAAGLVSLATLIDVPHLMFSQRNIVAFIINHLHNAVTVITMAACLIYFS